MQLRKMPDKVDGRKRGRRQLIPENAVENGTEALKPEPDSQGGQSGVAAVEFGKKGLCG